jgi:hypothetical protein
MCTDGAIVAVGSDAISSVDFMLVSMREYLEGKEVQ